MKYIHKRNSWKLILEARDNRKKIKKFINNEVVINWSHELDKNYSIWIANTFKDELIKELEVEGKFKKDRKNDNIWNKGDALRLMKAGDDVDEEKESKSDRRLNQVIVLYYERMINRLTPKYRYVLDWTRGRMRDAGVRENLKGLSLEEAWNKSDEWHKALAEGSHVITDEEGTILMSFNDDYYWLDLETDSSSEEAEAMGHCGTTNYGTTLFSLRKNKQPHVTIAFNEDDNMITQAKGKGNTKPDEKYHEYIVDLLINPNIRIDGFEYEYLPESDFQINDLNDELLKKLYNGNKKIFENAKGFTNLVLYSRGLIGKKEVVSLFNDVVIDEESGDLYFTVDGWVDTADLVFEDSRDYSTNKWAKKVLSGETDFYGYDIKFEFGNNWDDINIETMKKIKEAILEKQDSIDVIYNKEGDELVDLVLTEDNLIVSDYLTVFKIFHPGHTGKVWHEEHYKKKKIGGMYLKLSDDEIYDMSDILDENRNSGYMKEIVDDLTIAAKVAYEWSLVDKWWEKVTNLVINYLSADVDEKNKDRFKFLENQTKLGFKLDIYFVIKLMEESEECELMDSDNIAYVYERSSDWDGDEGKKKITYIDERGIWGDVSENINDAIQNSLDF